jgi:type I restriction enzyme S subunit
MPKSEASVYGISKNSLRSIEVHLPRIEEQTAIAAVLSDMDAEVEAPEARREKTRRIKQGMMQELLTGRTRLV